MIKYYNQKQHLEERCTLLLQVAVYHVQIAPLSLGQNEGLLFLSIASSSVPDLGSLVTSLLPKECHSLAHRPLVGTVTQLRFLLPK